jgi:hypothetical protein
MNVTYQREVGHCSKSNYVKEYTVGNISPAENSDSLDVVKFVEIDYQTVVKRGDLNNLYWRVVDSLGVEDKLPLDIVFYGEIYGAGVQDIHYGKKDQGIRVFAASQNGQYLSYRVVAFTVMECGMEPVKFHRTMFNGLTQLKEEAERKSEYYDGMREGIVITSVDEPNKMAKLLSEMYMERKNKIERH